MNWELRTVGKRDWAQDDSGVYTLIQWTPENKVRVDVMNAEMDMPAISFIGEPHDVRIALMRWLSNQTDSAFCRVSMVAISLEHAAYIGSEIHRASIEQANYVQD